MSLDSIFVKSILKNLIVLDEFIVKLGAPLDLTEVESSRENSIHDLAINSSSGALLNL